MRNTSVWLIMITLTGVASQDAFASSASDRWQFTVQAGQADYDRLLTGDAAWWGRVDDGSTSVALGISYDLMPQLGIRLMHERGRSLVAENRCPEGAVCTGIAFTESASVDNWTVAARPQTRLGDRIDLYATVGLMRWSISPGPQITSDSGNKLVFGPGISYGVTKTSALGIEYQRAGSAYSALRATYSIRF